MKKFLTKVKTDIKFKKAGEGHRLNEESTSTASFQKTEKNAPIRSAPLSEVQAQSAAAAIQRLDQQKNPPRPKSSRARIRTTENIQENNSTTCSMQDPEVKNVTVDTAPVLSVLGVQFISPFTNELLAKSQLRDHYRQHLIMRLSSDGINASCQMIHTINKDKEKLAAAINILCKYLDNIINNPEEAKYRKIKKSNKVFSEKVSEVQGCEEFLIAIGFKATMQKPPKSDEEELYYILPQEVAVETLSNGKEVLKSTAPLKSKLHRNPMVFKPTKRMQKFNLPSEFYNLTSAEVKREQQNKTEEIERSKVLRTKAMRDKEAQEKIKKYNFTLLRIRFPDGWILQGTFRVTEKLSDLLAFIRECIEPDWVPYDLRTAIHQAITGEDESLAALDLVPAAVVNLSWNSEVKAQLDEQRTAISLKPHLLQNTHEL